MNIMETTAEKNGDRFRLLRHKALEVQTERIWSEFEAAGFAPVLIKGWAAARLYPEPSARAFVDVDLMIAPELYEQAAEFSRTLKNNFPVDLHSGARHLDTVDYADLQANAVEVECGSGRIRMLRPEDHLRVLCVHWLNDGGSDREKLYDIYYAVARRSERFDWDRFLNVVDAKRRRWLVCAVGVAHKYLDLKIADTPIAREAEVLPTWLTKTIEREWRSDVKTLPLHYFLTDKKALWKQIKKRIPPNAVQATVEVDGEFDDKIRVLYQARDIMLRARPSLRRIGKTFFGGWK